MNYHVYEKEIKELVRTELKNYSFNDRFIFLDMIDFTDRFSTINLSVYLEKCDIPTEKVKQTLDKVIRYIVEYQKEMPDKTYDQKWSREDVSIDLKELKEIKKLLKEID